MLNKLIEIVEQLGGSVDLEHCGAAEHVRLLLDGTTAEFVVLFRERAPYPGEIPSLMVAREQLAQHVPQWPSSQSTVPLLVTRYVSANVGGQLTQAGWSWIDAVGNCDLRASGLRVHIRSSERPPQRRGRLPMGPANLRIIRTVLGRSAIRDWATGALAQQTGASPAVVNQTMRKLGALDLCSHTARGWWAIDAAALLDRFMTDYPGPGGTERYYYGDADLRVLAVRLTSAYRVGVAVSADLGPDLIAPYRIPTTLVVYTRPNVKLAARGELVEVSTLGAANVVQVFPKDETVFPRESLLGSTTQGDVQLADPVQMIWDLERLGGEDRDNAVHEMRQWLNR
jgi:hypothetical protein